MLGDAAGVGDAIMLWCNLAAAGASMGANTAVPLPADLATYAERYGSATAFVDFRARLTCQHRGSGDLSTIVDSHEQAPGERKAGEDPD